MEATKKKKAYLKPEMTKFEMKTKSNFMVVSSVIITPEAPDVNWMEGIIDPKCTQNGVAKALQVGGQTCFTVNHDDINSCELFYKLGVKAKTDIVKLTRISETQYRAEKTDFLCATTDEIITK
mgnify:CR=1 FL=1